MTSGDIDRSQPTDVGGSYTHETATIAAEANPHALNRVLPYAVEDLD